MSRRYFGTDGVRGRVGTVPMTPDFALKLGWAAGKVLGQKAGARVLIGKDTRRSGYMLESALEAGFAAAGVETDLLGPIPTPAVSYLTRAFRAQAGVVISASHNPYHDNGIKFFGANGLKLSDDTESQIEALLDQPLVCEANLGSARRIDDAQGRYIEFCKSTFPNHADLSGLHIVLDCANGAAYKTAPAVFRELGARVTVIANEPNGLNINQDCGSTHPEHLQTTVMLHKADVGIALDGDADRCLMIDPRGQLIDGDQILYLIALHRHRTGSLKGPVVGTLMSNLGLEQALKREGLAFVRANVGDRYVMELLQQHGGVVGGEGSGHTLCLDKSIAGDGTVTALQVLAALIESRQTLHEAVSGMVKCPQVLLNLKGLDKALLKHEAVVREAAAIETTLGSRGRLLLRASGTEALIRVMVEADDLPFAQAQAERMAAVLRRLV